MNDKNTYETEQSDKTTKSRSAGSRHVILDRAVELPDYDMGDPVYGEDGAGPAYDEYSQVRPRTATEEQPKSKLAKLRGPL